MRQRYKCYQCNRIFVEGDRRFIQNLDKHKAIVIQEYTDGKSIRGAVRSANISHTTAAKLIREVSNDLPDVHDAYEEFIKD